MPDFFVQAGECAIGTLGSAAKIIARPSTAAILWPCTLLKRRGPPAASPIRIVLGWRRYFSSSAAAFSPAFQFQHNAVDRSSLPGAIA